MMDVQEILNVTPRPAPQIREWKPSSHECAWIAATEAFEVHGYGRSGSLPLSPCQGSSTGRSGGKIRDETIWGFGVVGVVFDDGMDGHPGSRVP